MEKSCPKCGILHEKSGKFCSRVCANSRTFSDESKKKKSESQKKFLNSLSDEDKLKYITISRNNMIKVNKNKPKNNYELKIRTTETIKGKTTIKDKKGTIKSWEESTIWIKRKILVQEQDGYCGECNLNEWRGKPIPLELEHRDGNRTNNSRENLVMLCPNCHGLTDTWRGRNKASVRRITDEIMTEALKKNNSIYSALISLGLAPKGGNYKRAHKLLKELQSLPDLWVS